MFFSRWMSWDESALVLKNAPNKVLGNANVDGTTGTAGKNIDIRLRHASALLIGMAGTSPAMTTLGGLRFPASGER